MQNTKIKKEQNHKQQNGSWNETKSILKEQDIVNKSKWYVSVTFLKRYKINQPMSSRKKDHIWNRFKTAVDHIERLWTAY